MWNKIHDPNQSQCYGGGSEELRAQSVTELSPGHWDPGHLTPPTQVPVASPTLPSPGRHQYPKEFPPHPSPTPREERGLTRLFIVAGVLPRHLMEKLQSRNQRMYAQEGANQPWVPTHMETVLSYLVQLLGLPWPPAGSACLPDCIVRALSLPMKLCRATPGAKPNSSHLQELTSSLLSSWSGAGLPTVLTFSSLSAGTAVLSTTKLWGTIIFFRASDCPHPHHNFLSAGQQPPNYRSLQAPEHTFWVFLWCFWFVLFSMIFSVKLSYFLLTIFCLAS